MEKWQVVRNEGTQWSEDFEGSEYCVFESEEDAIECCKDMARMWSCDVDNFGYVKLDKDGLFYDHDVELVPRRTS